MAKAFTNEQLREQISKKSEEAEKLLKDKDRMEDFLKRLEHKLIDVPVFGEKLSNVPVLVSLVRAFVQKDYRDIPLGIIIAIVSALIYVFSPIDLLPDIIPGVGHVDDVAVVAFVWKMVENDVEEYKQWQVKNGKRVARY